MDQAMRAAIGEIRAPLRQIWETSLVPAAERLAALVPENQLDLEIARAVFAADMRTKFAILAIATALAGEDWSPAL